jgi:glycosyltransferase involved in cell wall biosynthesis
LPARSVIVCTRYRPDLLGRCLAALADQEGNDHEVIVVDNTPGDPETERVVSSHGFGYLVEPRVGLSRARNRGALAASGDLVAFIDDDAIPALDWLEKHAAALEDSRVAATTGRIRSAGVNGSARAARLDLGETGFEVSQSTPYWFELAAFGGVGFGGNMVLRRELFNEGFRFAEDLGAGTSIGAYEEAYAFYTLVRDGAQIAYLPEAVVEHYDQGPPGTPKSREIWGAHDYGGFITLLLLNEPRFRRRTASYILKALGNSRRPWRRPEARPRPVNRLRMLVAACRGSLSYLAARR